MPHPAPAAASSSAASLARTMPAAQAWDRGLSTHVGPTLFYDGECGLCNRTVRLLLRFDFEGRLRFAPLQGKTAQAYLRQHGLPTSDFDTITFVPDWSRRDHPEYLMRTTGVIGALRAAGNGWARFIADMLALFPGWLRDLGYKLVGRTRYAIFGAWVPKPLKRPEWAERFLP